MHSSGDYILGLIDGLQAGSLLFMGLYGLYLYWLNRDTAYLFYALYWCIVCGELLLKITPLAYVWPVISYSVYYYRFFALSYVVYSLFVARLIELYQYSPHYWRLLIVALSLYAGMSIYLIANSFTFMNTLSRIFPNLHRTQFSILYSLIHKGPALLLVGFLLILIWRSHSNLKGYLLIMVGLTIFTIIGSLVYHQVALIAESERLSKSPGPLKPFEAYNNVTRISYAFNFIGLVLQGFCFTLALAYRSRLIERDNAAIKATYTQQLEKELAERTQELRTQERLLEEERFRQLEQTFESKQAETEMAALRAQMNPHFIFNCLNAIKYYSTDHESAKAAEYLTKFAKLIRLVLENSRSDRVILNDELQALELYMEMEAMRFGSKLTFHLEVSPTIDTEFIEIPPLLIQPYVENAIWHGLMQKEEGGTVWVQVEQLQETNLLITIRDDGVGRVNAMELKSKSANQRKSFGMKITSDRIELINQLYHTITQVEIQDLTDVNGQPVGTKVILQIPT